MSDSPDNRDHDLMVAIFSVSAGLVGVCLTGIGLLRVVTSVHRVTTFGTDLLALESVLFVASCLFSFMALRGRNAGFRTRMRQWADGVFLFGLVSMAATCVVVAYSVI